MQMSDNTQNQRRVRALLDTNEMKLILARAVAEVANVDLTCPDVRVETLNLVVAPMPGCSAAEVIIVVDHPTVVKASDPRYQTELHALRGVL